MPATATPPSAATIAAPRVRILQLARTHFIAHGYASCTMDDLARELGMSKKTLYLHYRSKEAIMEGVIDGIFAEARAMATALFADRSLSFTEKLHRFTEGMTKRFTTISPQLLRDLQRFAPKLYQHIEDMRHTHIPVIFGQLLQQGQAAGMVRAEIDPAFAIAFWRPAIQSLMHPDALERLQLRPDQVFNQAITLFFGGLLTPAGRKAHEKLLAR